LKPETWKSSKSETENWKQPESCENINDRGPILKSTLQEKPAYVKTSGSKVHFRLRRDTLYSPELNLDEYLDGNLKNKVHSGKQIRNQEDIEKSPVHLCGLSLNGLLMSVIISSTQE
jgi:hypothetical protein